eukprot:6267432-Ditylum_brightwellii.AAC.1
MGRLVDLALLAQSNWAQSCWIACWDSTSSSCHLASDLSLTFATTRFSTVAAVQPNHRVDMVSLYLRMLGFTVQIMAALPDPPRAFWSSR